MNEAYKMFYDMERAVPEVDQLLKLLQEQIKAESFNEADITVKQLKSVISPSDCELMRLTGILNTRKMLTNK
jgi:elongation factor P--beta-lysine ligase